MAATPAQRPDAVHEQIADYVLSFEITSPLAYETATYCLMDSLACVFQALAFPVCARLLGPVVPGATLTGGARVPGTSYELDPINAAFNIGAMIGSLDCNDTWLAADWGHPSDNLGGILAVADYLSRSGRPVNVRHVLTGMIKAYEIHGVLALDHALPVCVASTAVVSAMLGGTRDQIVGAVSNAWLDGDASTSRHAPNNGSRRSWTVGDATSRAVRHALFALKGGTGSPCELSATIWGFGVLPQPFGSHVMESLGNAMRRADGLHSLAGKFEASVSAHFKPRQSELIKKVFEDQAALAAMPVSDFVAKLVSAS